MSFSYSTVASHAITAFGGWSQGTSFVSNGKQAQEILQGKNTLGGAFFQGVQMITVLNLSNHLITHIPSSGLRLFLKTSSFAASFFAIPLFLALAAIKEDTYFAVAAKLNAYIRGPIKLPTKLPASFVYLVKKSHAYWPALLATATAITTVALLLLGHSALAIGVITGAALGLIDFSYWKSKKVVDKTATPSKLNWVLPALISVGLLISGQWLYGTALAFIALSSISKKANRRIITSIDSLICRILKAAPFANEIDPYSLISIASLQEPLKNHRDLSLQAMNQLLTLSEADFEINPAYSMIKPETQKQLPSDYDFSKLLSFFNSYDWEKESALIKAKLRDDERFLEYITTKYAKPGVEKDELLKEWESLLDLEAKEKNLSLPAFLADYTKKEIEQLVAVLKGEKVAVGPAIHIEKARHHFAIVIAHLNALDPVKESAARQDLLLKSAIEAGSYCALGVKAAALEMVDALLFNFATTHVNEENFDIQLYEKKLHQLMMSYRETIYDAMHQQIALEIKAPTALSHDQHGHEWLRSIYAYGFIPLTPAEEEANYGSNLMAWHAAARLRHDCNQLLIEKMTKLPTELGKMQTALFFRHLVLQSKGLTEKDKRVFLEAYDDIALEKSSTKLKKLEKSYLNVMFYMLGIIRIKEGHPKKQPVSQSTSLRLPSQKIPSKLPVVKAATAKTATITDHTTKVA